MSIRKKPWNRVNSPVYSLATKGPDTFNMNICTYVTPVSMHPKKYMVAVYEGTKTLENLKSSGEAVLQLLGESQYKLVNYLGKKSGYNTNKMRYLENRQLLDIWEGYPVLTEALSVILLKVRSSWPSGDHTCFLCDAVKYKNITAGVALDIDTLREKGMVRM